MKSIKPIIASLLLLASVIVFGQVNTQQNDPSLLKEIESLKSDVRWIKFDLQMQAGKIQQLEDSLKKLTHQQLSDTSVQSNAKQKSKGQETTDDNLYLKNNIGRGEYLQLSDGSLWQVESLDRLNCSLWLSSSDVKVVNSNRCLSGLMIINVDESSSNSVCAKRIK